MSHYVDYKKGRKYNSARQTISTFYGDNARDQVASYIGKETIPEAAKRRLKEKLAQRDFSEINNIVNNTEGMEKRVYSAARDLNDPRAVIGTHQFEILIPDNPQDFNEKKLKELGVEPMRDLGNGEKGWVIGGHSRKRA